MKDYKTWYQRVMDALIEKQGTKSSGEKSHGDRADNGHKVRSGKTEEQRNP